MAGASFLVPCVMFLSLSPFRESWPTAQAPVREVPPIYFLCLQPVLVESQNDNASITSCPLYLSFPSPLPGPSRNHKQNRKEVIKRGRRGCTPSLLQVSYLDLIWTGKRVQIWYGCENKGFDCTGLLRAESEQKAMELPRILLRVRKRALVEDNKSSNNKK